MDLFTDSIIIHFSFPFYRTLRKALLIINMGLLSRMGEKVKAQALLITDCHIIPRAFFGAPHA